MDNVAAVVEAEEELEHPVAADTAEAVVVVDIAADRWVPEQAPEAFASAFEVQVPFPDSEVVALAVVVAVVVELAYLYYSC